MLLVIDNYDSFTYNLVQYFQQLGTSPVVHRNDALTVAEVLALQPERLVISPGPCTPDDAGISLALIEQLAGKIPILGVCLGHQAIAQAFGAKVIRAQRVMHGKTSLISHRGERLFHGLQNPLNVTRYHSLLVEALPEDFVLDAWFDDPQFGREIMAISQPALALFGVQFHPESIMSQQGHELLANFLKASIPAASATR
ncbi:aminodeoxychorismate/anthranilate synthase component II [Shewanella yunxiaonensis]|uniref:Aminodeoxychorismate/anthranilate synthase component II n=1 Tax=Shewanella yunxiaonensis TaxID=2829809 RepID=A0ABX7YT86_9GAMM|nr:aminodeoxychorismate/anthranilate synthase component II [Shewanella yunxiaonensis]QUN05321.1 aminodeoxychorismate/anthranilate synthase component II [Shewanella yunxiaonensis]